MAAFRSRMRGPLRAFVVAIQGCAVVGALGMVVAITGSEAPATSEAPGLSKTGGAPGPSEKGPAVTLVSKVLPQASDVPPNQVFRAVEGLKESNVFVYPTGELALADELDTALEDSSIGVVVIPGSAKMESYDELAQNTSNSNGYKYDNFAEAIYDKVDQDQFRTIVVLSKNHVAVDSNQSVASIESLLEGASARNPEQIILSQAKIEDYNEVLVGEWLPWLSIPVGVVFLIVLAGDYFSTSKSRRRRTLRERRKRDKRDVRLVKERAEAADREAKAQAALERKALESIPSALRDRIANIQSWARDHVVARDAEFAGEITSMADRFKLLFERLEERGTPQGREVAMVGYTDMLGKISAALSEKYYLDILEHPELWDDPAARIEQVKRAVRGVSFQLLENIKQVNAARDLDFKASLEALAGFMDNPRLEDIYGEDNG